MNACLCAFLLLTAGLGGPAPVSTEPIALPQLARLVSGDPLPHAPPVPHRFCCDIDELRQLVGDVCHGDHS